MKINLYKGFYKIVTDSESEKLGAKIEGISSENQSKVLLIVNEEEVEDSSKKELLMKILGAVNLNDENVILLAHENGRTIPYRRLKGLTNIEKVLVFGLDPKELGLAIMARKNQPIGFEGKEFLFTFGLTDLFQNSQYKAGLWTALKSTFAIKP